MSDNDMMINLCIMLGDDLATVEQFVIPVSGGHPLPTPMSHAAWQRKGRFIGVS